MTHSDLVLKGLQKLGPSSDYKLYHYVRGEGVKASPSSIRTRRRELQDRGLVEDSGERERTPSGKSATIWKFVPGGKSTARFTAR